jgi:hypothetical protein
MVKSRKSLHDVTTLRVHCPSGRRATTTEAERPGHAKKAVLDSRGNVLAIDATGVRKGLKRKRTKSQDVDQEDEQPLVGKRSELDHSANKEDLDFLNPSSMTRTTSAVSLPSSVCLPAILYHRFAQRLFRTCLNAYTISLVNSSKSVVFSNIMGTKQG